MLDRLSPLEAFERAAAERPADADAQVFLGNALVEAGRAGEAIPHYLAALALRPDHGPTRYNLGNAYLRLGEAAEAETCYRAALARDPGHAGGHNNLGNAVRAQGRLAEAAECYAAAVALRPDVAGTRNNLGSALIALRRPAEALPHLLEAVRLDQDVPDACNNLGGALLALDRPDEALGWFARARAARPNFVQAEFGSAMALLATGRFIEGWEAYEARWRDPGFLAGEVRHDSPLWDGMTDPAGLTILLHAEQGLGDTIQFVRYAPLLRAHGARVILQVQPSLVALCRPLADMVLATGTVPPHDQHCPLLSLPRAFGTTLESIPCDIPYLRAAAKWSAREPGYNIGVVFSGADDHPEDDLRSIPAALWQPVLDLPVNLHLLQLGLRPADALALRGGRRLHRPRLADFSATASVVAAMDLIITVDTAVAHLAGAMGRPVFVLLQHAADFRWLRQRDDSPWYPTARLFRQGVDRDWRPVLVGAARQAARYIQPASTTNV